MSRTITVTGTAPRLVACFTILREAIRAESITSIFDFDLVIDADCLKLQLHLFVKVKENDF